MSAAPPRSRGARGLLALVVLAPGIAAAQRPVLADEATYGVAGGEVLVHYATTGADAVPARDDNADAVPDFVAEVAATAELAIAHYTSRGFRRPRSDDARGGDGRIDLYLRDLVAADGNIGTDACDGGTCIAYAIAENDYAGFNYPSVTEAIRSVVPHELFHLVQYAYASDQSPTWTEGSAVWAVEELFGADNADFERFIPAFLAKLFRPFERPAGAFGDAYPYGAALWPYFLAEQHGPDVIADAWLACASAPFLDAIDQVLVGRGTSLDAAWIAFTRWLLSGPERGWPSPLREPLREDGMVYIEGLSARYVTFAAEQRTRIELAPGNGIRIAAWAIADGRGLADGIDLAGEGGLGATLGPGAYTLVVTGLSRATLTTPVAVTFAVPGEVDPGCATTRPTTWLVSVLLALLALRQRAARSSR